MSGPRALQSLAPELFDLDEFGNAHEVGDGSVPAGLETRLDSPKATAPRSRSEVTEE